MSELKVNKISPRSGTDVTLGDSGDTFTLGSGANIAGLTLSDNILFDTASKGIYLGVTSATASNLLDDYEEGTFTPTLVDSSLNAATGSFGGRYTKIGNRVTLDIRLVNIDKTGLTAGSGIFIGGLPFATQSSDSGIYSIGSVMTDTFTYSGYVISELRGSEAFMILKDCSSGSGDSTILVSDIGSSGSSDLLITHTYETA